MQIIHPPSPAKTGSPVTMIFLHDGLACVEMWRDIPARLVAATGMPALVYDRVGYGKSDPFPGPLTPDFMHGEAFQILPEVLSRTNVSRAVLIGHSDGGSISLLFAARFPKRVAGVISLAAHVFVEERTLEGIRQAVENYHRSDFSGKLARYHGDKTDATFKAWSGIWLSPQFRDWNIENYLRGITAPLLVIQGEDDEFGTMAQVEAIAGQVAGPVEIFRVPGAAHAPHHQARKKVLAQMESFLKSIPV